MAQKNKLIAASILSANFAKLGDDVNAVLKAGVDWVHFDVMDQHFVPNLTLGPMVCQSLRDFEISAPIDVHLMVKPVDLMIERFAKAGATHITFHPEASDDVSYSLDLIHGFGCTAGLALNPDVDLSVIENYWGKIDLLLLMSVFPGFGGQVFIADAINKIALARKEIDALSNKVMLQVDGGVNARNLSEVSIAGADVFVMGSAIFADQDYVQRLVMLRDQI